MSLDYLTIGRRIHRLRKRADITQQMLAEKIGTSTAYISQLERGTKGISIENEGYSGCLLDRQAEEPPSCEQAVFK